MNKLQFCVLMACCGVAMSLTACDKPKNSARFGPMRDMVVSGKYDEAIASLEAYVDKSPTGRDASRAGLFLFKANFAKENYDEAKKWCDWTIKNHPQSLEARKCEFKTGLVLLPQDKPEEALKRFESIAIAKNNPLRPEATFFVDYLKKELAAIQNDPVADPQ